RYDERPAELAFTQFREDAQDPECGVVAGDKFHAHTPVGHGRGERADVVAVLQVEPVCEPRHMFLLLGWGRTARRAYPRNASDGPCKALLHDRSLRNARWRRSVA